MEPRPPFHLYVPYLVCCLHNFSYPQAGSPYYQSQFTLLCASFVAFVFAARTRSGCDLRNSRSGLENPRDSVGRFYSPTLEKLFFSFQPVNWRFLLSNHQLSGPPFNILVPLDGPYGKTPIHLIWPAPLKLLFY